MLVSFWFRSEGRGTFLCSAKEKHPKETRIRRLARYAGAILFGKQEKVPRPSGRNHETKKKC
jgi:hypothetical protein